ncbi:MAG: cell division protein DedD, partial [Bacteroides sp.]|nr:cell division protein DedD [Bacteroides sp.]
MLNKWDERFIRMAVNVAEWSKDPGTKVGAVLVSDRRILAT